jgi:hypothetical protein
MKLLQDNNICNVVIPRCSAKEVQNLCRGFFDHYGHLGKHFEWLTNASCLDDVVEENLNKQLGV